MCANLKNGHNCLSNVMQTEMFSSGPIKYLGLIPGQILEPLTKFNSSKLIDQKRMWINDLFSPLKSQDLAYGCLIFINNTTPNNISFYSTKNNSLLPFNNTESSLLQPWDFINALKSKKVLSKDFQVLELHNTCASVAAAVQLASKRVKLGLNSKIMIIGFENTNNNPLTVAALFNLKVMNMTAASLETAMMPFSSKRGGFTKADCIGFLTVEKGSADKKLVAEVLGGAVTSDSHSLTDGIEDGSMVQETIELALKQSRLKANEVDYINAHGSGTYLNDLIETRGIKRAFSQNYKSIKVATTKSQFGHALAATGIVEIASICSMMENDFIAGSINSLPRDEEIDLNIVSAPIEKQKINIALKNSFGFGGYNSVIILKNAKDCDYNE